MSLQERFLKSKGDPIRVGDDTVVQMDRIPVKKGIIKINFLGGDSELTCGVALKSARGGIVISNGKRVKLIHIWDEASLPKKIEHEVNCPDGELRVWNIYRIKHKGGQVTEDAWTNNAGMVVTKRSTCCRRYRCSDGIGAFSPKDHLFEISWYEVCNDPGDHGPHKEFK